MTTRTYDVVVLGAGAVGENVADRASRTGLAVAVVEEALAGGECSYWACMPSKALLRPGAALSQARATPGVSAGHALDVGAVLARRDAIVQGWDDAGQVEWIEGAGLTLVRGHGRLAGPRLIAMDDGTGLAARHAVVVATGSEPVLPDVPGLDEVTPWTSRDATALHEVPASVVVLGGGVVACEMATALADLGAAVTVLVRGERMLAGMEPFASEAVTRALGELGVDVRLRTRAVAVAPDAGGVSDAGGAGDAGGSPGVRVTLDGGGEVRAERLLAATGRRPRTRDLGLEVVGLRAGAPLPVDDAGCVLGVEGGWLFAAGDVTGRTNTTHQGKYDARVAGDVVAHRFGRGAAGAADEPEADDDPGAVGRPQEASDLGSAGSAEVSNELGAAARRDAADDPEAAGDWSRFRATADYAAVPQVVFTRPEVATVGLTEAAARAAGIDVRAVVVPFTSVAGSAFSTQEPGTACLVVDRAREVVVGATFVGPEVAELLHAATVAIVGEVPLARLWHAVPAYPTRSEIWLRLLEAYGL